MIWLGTAALLILTGTMLDNISMIGIGFLFLACACAQQIAKGDRYGSKER